MGDRTSVPLGGGSFEAGRRPRAPRPHAPSSRARAGAPRAGPRGAERGGWGARASATRPGPAQPSRPPRQGGSRPRPLRPRRRLTSPPPPPPLGPAGSDARARAAGAGPRDPARGSGKDGGAAGSASCLLKKYKVSRYKMRLESTPGGARGVVSKQRGPGRRRPRGRRGARGVDGPLSPSPCPGRAPPGPWSRGR